MCEPCPSVGSLAWRTLLGADGDCALGRLSNWTATTSSPSLASPSAVLMPLLAPLMLSSSLTNLASLCSHFCCWTSSALYLSSCRHSHCLHRSIFFSNKRLVSPPSSANLETWASWASWSFLASSHSLRCPSTCYTTSLTASKTPDL